MTILSTEPEVQQPYVTRRPGVCGGKPIIAGTRIKVSLVAREHVEMGMTPQQIQEAHPHLTLAQIHAALSYYYDHEAEIQAELREADEFVEKMRQEAGPSPVAARLRAERKLRP
jgi:uncharacterized protein (DUF433 family)